MFGITRLAKAVETLTKELKNMSAITEQLNAEIAKIAEKNFGDDTVQINEAVATAIEPVETRISELEQAVLNALKAINDDDVAAAQEALEGVEVPVQPDETQSPA